jgi:hypothetical protein
MPAPLIKPEGTAQQDGERHAAKRFMAKLRQDPPQLTGSITEDRLRSHAPHLETWHAYGGRDIRGVTAGDQA